MIGTYFSIISHSFPFLASMVILNGFFTISSFSIAYELGVELSYPVGEATSNGFINTAANLLGFTSSMILTPILKHHMEQDVLISFIMFAIMIVLAMLFMLKAEIKLKRSN